MFWKRSRSSAVSSNSANWFIRAANALVKKTKSLTPGLPRWFSSSKLLCREGANLGFSGRFKVCASVERLASPLCNKSSSHAGFLPWFRWAITRLSSPGWWLKTGRNAEQKVWYHKQTLYQQYSKNPYSLGTGGDALRHSFLNHAKPHR